MAVTIDIHIFSLRLFSVHSEMVDLGSRQGRSPFATAVVVDLRRGSQKGENAVLGQKMPFPDGY